MKLYEKTHPWITFRIDLREVPYSFWMKLGECTSKIEHISRVPLVHDSADDLYKIYLAKGVQATTAIEGNTLSEEQVRQHIEGVLELPPSQEYLAQEVDNILKAINAIYRGDPRGNSQASRQSMDQECEPSCSRSSRSARRLYSGSNSHPFRARGRAVSRSTG